MQRKYTLGGGMVKMMTIMSNHSCTNTNLQQKKMGVFQRMREWRQIDQAEMCVQPRKRVFGSDIK